MHGQFVRWVELLQSKADKIIVHERKLNNDKVERVKSLYE